MGLGFAMLRTIFSEAKLGMAIGLVATTVAVSSSLGPAVSGAILSFASWRAVFGLLAALSLIALCMGWFALPNTPPTTSHFDLLGSMMVILMFGALLVAINGLAAGGGPKGRKRRFFLSICLRPPCFPCPFLHRSVPSRRKASDSFCCLFTCCTGPE